MNRRTRLLVALAVITALAIAAAPGPKAEAACWYCEYIAYHYHCFMTPNGYSNCTEYGGDCFLSGSFCDRFSFES